MATTNGGPAEDLQPQLTVVMQYVKDFSFENPNAPGSLAASTEPPQIGIQINQATEADVPVILDMIRGLAEYEKLLHVVRATEEQLRLTLFGERPGAEVLLANWNGEPIGFTYAVAGDLVSGDLLLVSLAVPSAMDEEGTPAS